jgi:hypothetical protein
MGATAGRPYNGATAFAGGLAMLLTGFLLLVLIAAALLVVLVAVATMIKEWQKDRR